MDDLARHNKERWEDLSGGGIVFGRPWLDLTPDEARKRVDPEGLLLDPDGKDVLLLAGAGGQQSAAFGLLGANVTVIDLCENQLASDRRAAEHYGLSPRLEQGDMRDLSRFDDASFDMVWHAHSINFIPDARVVFREVARVMRPGGRYRLACANPFAKGIDEESWNGYGFSFSRTYQDGAEQGGDPRWDVWDEDGNSRLIEGPREFLHTFSTLVNVPIQLGFRLLGAWEDGTGDPNAYPGSWDHLQSVIPVYLIFCWAFEGTTDNSK